MKRIKHLNKRLFVMALLVSLIALTSACGNKLVKGASPMVRLTELSHADGTVNLQISIRNLNGVDMEMLGAELKLVADGAELLNYRGPVQMNIAANGTESWSVDADESDSGRQLLDKLENGEVKSLPYSLTGSITSREDGLLRFEYEGHIYPLPGRPGYFR